MEAIMEEIGSTIMGGKEAKEEETFEETLSCARERSRPR